MPYRRCSAPRKVQAKAIAAASSGIAAKTHHAPAAGGSNWTSWIGAACTATRPELSKAYSGDIARHAASETPYASLIVLVYNEADSVEPLHRGLIGVLDGLGTSLAVIYVDDG